MRLRSPGTSPCTSGTGFVSRCSLGSGSRRGGYTDWMLEQIRGPADLQRLSQTQLSELAGEIRQFLIHKVAATGGHLGPNLGVVELTLALHRVFDSPYDPIIFDTGHQAYVHKMLTGR